jgi:putative ABC transport system permease protein
MPPRLLRRLFARLAPSSLREELLAEGDDGFEERLRSRGRLAALLWYVRQLVSVDWVRLRVEVRPRATIRPRSPKEELMHSVFQDLRFAVRSIRRSPGFAAVVIATLALGIGVNVALVSVVRSVLLSPLPYGEPERVVSIWSQWSDFPKTWVSEEEYRYYREAIESFDQVALYDSDTGNLTDGDEPERIGIAAVTTNVFETLGVAPLVGRSFTSEEGKLSTGVVLISNRLWTRRYGGDPDLVGRRIEVDGKPATVVGILPRGFQLPIDYNAETRTDVYRPMVVPEGAVPIPEMGGSHNYFSVARLAGSASVAVARAEVLAANQRDTRDGIYPEEWRFRTLVIPVEDDIVGSVRPALWILMSAVGFVLLIACTNVANVVLSRGQDRRREVALRNALGAGSSRVFRQLFTESLLLALLGGAFAVVLAQWGLQLLFALEPGSIPRLGEARLDGPVLLSALGITLSTALVFGIVPALSASRVDLRAALGEGARGSSSGIGSRRIRLALVALQMTLAVVLVVAAGLMIRSFTNLLSIDPGFRADGILTMRLSAGAQHYPEDGDVARFYQRLVDEVKAIPGVSEAGAVRVLPLASQIGDWGMRIEGYEPASNEHPSADWQVATPGYLAALRIPVLEGRPFGAEDRVDSEPVLIVNQAFAEKYFPGESALGRSVFIGGGRASPTCRIVGVVGNVRHNGITAEIKQKWYLPESQAFLSLGFSPRSMTLTIRSSLPISTLAPSVRAVVHRIDPKLPVAEVRSLEDVLASSVAPARFTMALLVTFSALALLIASVGVYGVVSCLVSQRSTEIGIRVALGASRSKVLAMVGSEIVVVTAVGVVVGSGAALFLGARMNAILHGVRPSDPLTFAVVPVVLFTAATLGSLVPALRATRVDPVVALRSE